MQCAVRSAPLIFIGHAYDRSKPDVGAKWEGSKWEGSKVRCVPMEPELDEKMRRFPKSLGAASDESAAIDAPLPSTSM